MIPNLIHPVPVKIQRINRAVTIMDPVAREPVRQLWKDGEGPGTGTTTELVAQVSFLDGKIGKPDLEPGGPAEHTTGYLLFRYVDLIAAGVATDNGDGTITVGIVRGDRIVQIGTRVVNLYVHHFKDVGHYPDQSGASLLEVDFTDRQPSTRT